MSERKTSSPGLNNRSGRNGVDEVDDVRNVVNVEDKTFNLIDDVDDTSGKNHNAKQLYPNATWQNKSLHNEARSNYVLPPIKESSKQRSEVQNIMEKTSHRLTPNTRKKRMMQRMSSHRLLYKTAKIQSLDKEWGRSYSIAMGIHRDLLAGVGKSSTLIDAIKKSDPRNEEIENQIRKHIENVRRRLFQEESVEGVSSIAHYVNLRDESGCTALHIVCDKRMDQSSELAGILLDVGAQIDAQASSSGFTPLHLAIRRRQVDLAIYLLDHGAAPNIKTLSENAEDDLPTNERERRVSNAMNKRTNVESVQASWKGHFNESPLHMASKHCLVAVVEKLLELNANPNDRAYDGKTPLHYAFGINRDYKAVYLAAREASHPAKSSSHTAVSEENRLNWEHIKMKTFEQENPAARIAKMLIDAGGDVCRVDNKNIPAMTDLDIEYWYQSHKTEMLSLIGLPKLKGFDNPIFADPRTQHAIDVKWSGKTRRKLYQKLFTWIMFVVLLLAMVTYQFNRSAYSSRKSRAFQSIEEILINEPFQSDILAFEDIANKEELWSWFENVFIPAVYPTERSVYRKLNGSFAYPGKKSIATFNYVLGNPRIRMVRSDLKSKCSGILASTPNDGYCMGPQREYSFVDSVERRMNVAEEETQPPLICDGIGHIPYIYSKPKTVYTTVSRAFRYISDSYVLDLPSPHHPNATADIVKIKDNAIKCHLVDLNMRLIVFEFVAINPSTDNMIITVEIYVEFDVNGVIYPNFKIKQSTIFMSSDSTVTILRWIIFFYSLKYLLGELDELSTLEWNSNVRNLWPKFYILSIEKRKEKSHKIKQRLSKKTKNEQVYFAAEIASLSNYLQRSLYVEGEYELGKKYRFPAPTPFVSLRYAAAVAKTATDDTSDKYLVNLYVFLPWRQCKEAMRLDFFAADTHDNLMERIKQEVNQMYGRELKGETSLQVAQRPRNDPDTVITIPDDDSINDLYLLLRGVSDDTLKNDKDIKNHFYRFSFKDVPRNLNLVLRFTIDSESGNKIVVRPIGDWDVPHEFSVVSNDTIGHVITKLANKLSLHRRGIQLLTLDGEVLQWHEHLKDLGLVRSPLETVENFVKSTAALIFASLVFIVTSMYQTVVYIGLKLKGDRGVSYIQTITRIPHTKFRLVFKKTNVTIPRYFYRYRNILDLALCFLLVLTFVIEFYFAPRVEELESLSKQSFNTSDNFDISIFFHLSNDKMGLTELLFALSVFLCMLRTIAYLEVFPTVVKTIQLMYLMISELGVYLMFFFLIVISFAILYFVLFGQDQNGSFSLISIFINQFDQSTSGANFDIVHLSGEENSMWLLMQTILIMFTIITIIVLFNLVIAVVTSAYEDGVAQSSSWWAFTQLTMIHEDDFKDIRTSPKYMAKAFLKAKCYGKASAKVSRMQKAIDKQYNEIWTNEEHRKSITSSDLLRMNTSDALSEEVNEMK